MATSASTAAPAVTGGTTAESARVLTPAALEFVGLLERRFGERRRDLLRARAERRERIAAGEALDFPAETAAQRASEWRVAPASPGLDDRRVEITGPAERKMMINALNSGARVFMADLEDALSPTWKNVVDGQGDLMDAVRRTISLETPEKRYVLNERTATLVVRPRGWHLEESHVSLDGRPVSASLFDFGLYFFHNAAELVARGSGPYFYLPKMESRHEARLWNDVFVFAQEQLGIPRGTIRATVLIETILAAFEMDEILFELKEHAAGLNAGRWDYLFSAIKTFRDRPDMILPDRAQLTMAVPFMRAYARLLVDTCHRRGAHAIGGMAAFIPSRKDAEVNARAMAKVREDKDRESGDGFDGTWVAHPDLVPVAQEVFDRVLGERPNQKEKRTGVAVKAAELVVLRVDGGSVSLEGVRTNIDVALRYVEAWLRGQGAVAIHNLMEDAATAEISRSQLWQWVQHGAPLSGGGTMSANVYREVRDREQAALVQASAPGSRVHDAAALLDQLVLGDFQDFLTVPGYRMLDGAHATDAGGSHG
ncbi:MAG: malate synthase [Gemmatimonadetes bacterium]|nr:malate synthase [Gemmatimonadota bacterium]